MNRDVEQTHFEVGKLIFSKIGCILLSRILKMIL